ncbi:MAG: 4Fe-4S dicluster domain-containing protein [Desulfovibrionaceae bacterium]|nr:4Fe-4S dicluster domain-containing protein [Desulfovibrionaceae bacterium]
MLERVVFLAERCRACRRCEMACIAAHHGIDIKEATKRRSEFISRVRVVKGEGFKTTVRCHECRNAPCCQICPTGALHQLENGQVVMHEELCLACEMCADACPYGAIQMDTSSLPVVKMEDNPDDAELLEPRKVAVRCDMCRDLREQTGKWMTPCMEACPVQAIGILQENGETRFPEKPARKPVAAAPKPAPAAPAAEPLQPVPTPIPAPVPTSEAAPEPEPVKAL